MIDNRTQHSQSSAPNRRDAENGKGIKVKSLYKAVRLLDYFMDGKPELGVTELAQKSGMLKSSVSNILSTFEACGIVEKNQSSGKYHMGIKILELSNQLYLDNDLRRILHPVMERIADICQETVYLAALYGTEIIYLDSLFPRSNATGRNLIGLRAPAYCTGIGKALLAYQPSDRIEAVIQAGLHRFTPNTICSPDELREELSQIRHRGYSIDNMEHEPGVRCVALPIFNCEGSVVAAVSLSGPSSRFTDEKIEEFFYALKDQLGGLYSRIR